MFPYSRQNIDKTDILSAVRVLKSDFLTQGPLVSKFEKKISNYVKAKYAVATNSGSSALHIACLALNIKKGDLVWTVPNTFAATANCALHCGAKVDFVDIDKNTWNMSIRSLEKKLQKEKNKLPKIVIPVHFAGQPTDQKKIWELSKKFKFKIIEDASHSLGAKHFNEPVGSCKWSDITVFSFHPVKIITTGEGGMATTNNKKYSDQMRISLSNGIVKDSKLFKFKKKNQPWYYEYQKTGFNYRMNEMSAAIGISQLSKLKEFLKKRNEIAKLYKKILDKLFIKYQKINTYNFSSYHLFVIQFDLKKTKFSYLNIFKKLRSKNYFVNLHYMPLHLSPYFKKLGFKKNQYPNSEKYGVSSISLPIYYGLKISKVFKICSLIKSFVKY